MYSLYPLDPDISSTWWRHPAESAKRSQEQLDVLLIFAGLFSAINSSFLALTLPRLSPDPAEDTNALLSTLARQNDMKENGIYGLPSTSFSPSSDIVVINVFFSLSLTFSILASALVVLAQQGITGYHENSDEKVSIQPPPKINIGSGRWAVQFTVIDGVLSLLQASLLTFCISLILYLHHLKPVIGIIVGIPVHLAFFAFVALYTLYALKNRSPLPSRVCTPQAPVYLPSRHAGINFCIRLGDDEQRIRGEKRPQEGCEVHISVWSPSGGVEAWNGPK